MKKLIFLVPVLFVIGFIVYWANEQKGGEAPVLRSQGSLSYAEDVEDLMVSRCMNCHNAQQAKAGLVLAEGRGYDAMVEKAAQQDPSLSLVVPGDPESSYLWTKLMGGASKGKGMPRGPSGWKKLPREELELIGSWIQQGAKP